MAILQTTLAPFVPPAEAAKAPSGQVAPAADPAPKK
jgi:hypothetical protein